MPDRLQAADYDPHELAAILDGGKAREDARYDYGLWLSWHIGMFCRAAYHAKAYPTWKSVQERWTRSKAPEKAKQDAWKSSQDFMRSFAAAHNTKVKGKAKT